jgi:hypothetical protein
LKGSSLSISTVRWLFKDDYYNHPQSKLIPERYLEVLSMRDGEVLFRNDRLAKQRPGLSSFAGGGNGGDSPRGDPTSRSREGAEPLKVLQ